MLHFGESFWLFRIMLGHVQCCFWLNLNTEDLPFKNALVIIKRVIAKQEKPV